MFEGTGVALITPFKKDFTIDFDALARLVDYVIEGGVNYIVALGTTGETPTLSKEEKKEILNFIINCNKERVLMVVGVGGNNTQEVINDIKEFSDSSVDGILSVAPYYNKPSQEGIYQHFKAIASSTDKPIILYNVPGRTNSNILPATVARLASECKNIRAIKEASGDMMQCMELVHVVPEGFTVLSGDDALILPQVSIGFKGVISVAANCYATQFCEMVDFALNHNFDQARLLHYNLLKSINLLFKEGNPTGVKYVLSTQGYCENILRLPLVKSSDQLEQEISSVTIEEM